LAIEDPEVTEISTKTDLFLVPRNYSLCLLGNLCGWNKINKNPDKGKILIGVESKTQT
jgi:hypothetical protein